MIRLSTPPGVVGRGTREPMPMALASLGWGMREAATVPRIAGASLFLVGDLVVFIATVFFMGIWKAFVVDACKSRASAREELILILIERVVGSFSC